ncbi:hypothetical protein Goari_009043 [Gossypium aridum]|uniref:Uncharacterized protein n=1 Tax=Gossypium aridum TaxID=34290 RepID=A0A7J8XX65_GOSAI|nr:hypothetical protein [Gossypium aridum]
MLAEILKHAASNPITDFVNAKLTCKAFHGASNYHQIFENVSMDKLIVVPWRKKKGQVKAIYAYGIILICFGGSSCVVSRSCKF